MDRRIANTPKDIPGWGMDADPENDPTYPMKHWNGADHERIHYEKAPQQPQRVKLLKSIERPTITRVFGTSTPPTDLSRAIREHAFNYSESAAKHWMILILADRVDVVQGIIQDLRRGIVPNFVQELGWTAEWKYNRKNFVRRIVGKAIVVSLAVALLMRKKGRK